MLPTSSLLAAFAVHGNAVSEGTFATWIDSQPTPDMNPHTPNPPKNTHKHRVATHADRTHRCKTYAHTLIHTHAHTDARMHMHEKSRAAGDHEFVATLKSIVPGHVHTSAHTKCMRVHTCVCVHTVCELWSSSSMKSAAAIASLGHTQARTGT